MNSNKSHNHPILTRFLVAILGVISSLSAGITGSSTILATVAVGGVFVAGAERAEAQTVRRNTRQSASSVARNTRQTVRQVTRTPANAGRDIARNASQAGRQVSRNTRQSVRQISRRHFYSLPSGYRWRTYAGRRYCFYQGLYYYPYMHGGRTVYIQINVNSSGNPLPPPPATEVIVNVN